MPMITGRDKINIQGIGAIELNHLAQRDVKTFEDLARTDPYNYGLRFLGDKLVGWVNYARRVIADEVLKEIHVGDTITVRCSKTYDIELTLEAVKARLETYEYYVEVDRRVLPSMYEFIFTINREHRQYALGSWLEYKQTARLLREKMLIGGEKKEEPPKEEMHEIPYKELLTLFAPEVLDVGDVPLIKEVLLHLLFADRLNVLVASGPSIGAKTTLRNALERYASSFYSHHCGSSLDQVDFAETLAAMSEGVLSLEGLDSMTAEEKMMLYDILSSQNVKMRLPSEVREYSSKINIYAQVSLPDVSAAKKTGRRSVKASLPVDEEFLEYCHCIVFARPYSAAEFEELTRFVVGVESPDEEGVKRLRSYLQKARSIQLEHDGPPEEVYDFLKQVYKQREKVAVPVTPEIVKGVIELSKARSRMRLSPRVTREDFLHGLNLVKRCLETCGYQPPEDKR